MLAECFGVTSEAAPDYPARDAATRRAASIAWRCLLTGRALLQLARVPAFDAGRLQRIARDPRVRGSWDAVAAVPIIDKLPLALTQMAYAESLQIMKWLLEKEGERESLAKLQEKIFERTVRPMKAMATAGVSTLPLLQAAYHLDIPFRHLYAGVYQLGWGSRLRLFDRSSVDEDSAIGARLSRDKTATAACLRSAGLPAPEHWLVNNPDSALKAAVQLGWPVVVKPADRERSEGVTVGIRDNEQLLEAFAAVRAMSNQVLVEKEVPGICYRLLVANGCLRYAISRGPLAITADGTHTIAEMIALRNQSMCRQPPWERASDIQIDALTLDALSANGWMPSDVPPAGHKVLLRRIESSEWRGDIADVSVAVHPDNALLAVQAARLFGLLNAGIDLITTDISRPWHESGAIINEVNYAPYFGGNPTARATMSGFFGELMPDQGRIPVEVFVGQDAALHKAQLRQRELHADGIRACLTTHEHTRDADGRLRHLPADGLFARALALLMDKQLDALLMVVQTTELLQSGLPVDRVNRIDDSGEALAISGQTSAVTPAHAKARLLDLLGTYTRGRQPVALPLQA